MRTEQGHADSSRAREACARGGRRALGPRVCAAGRGQGQVAPHRGSDVALGLPELLPQPLCQRGDSILGSAVEMGLGRGWHSVAAHAGRREGRGRRE